MSTGTVGFPYFKNLDDDFFNAITSQPLPDGWTTLGKSGINAADQRCWLVEHFTGDWLLQVDSDEQWPSEAVERLLAANLPIVGGVVYKRGENFKPMVYQYDGLDEHGVHKYRSMDGLLKKYLSAHRNELSGHPVQVLANPHLVECDGLSSGFLLVHRKVFDQIGEPWFSFAERGTEDLYFCRKAKAAGFGIWADLSVQVGHYAKILTGYPHFLAANGAIK